MKITYEGMKATAKYLNVYGRVESGTVVQFCEMKIPVSALDVGILEESLDRRVRLDLLAIWSADRGDEALW